MAAQPGASSSPGASPRSPASGLGESHRCSRLRLSSGRNEFDVGLQRPRAPVTVRRQVLVAAEVDVVAGRASLGSVWIDKALEETVRHKDLAALLTELPAENGAATLEKDAWARRVRGLAFATPAH